MERLLFLGGGEDLFGGVGVGKPGFARPVRGLGPGEHAFLALLPGVLQSPALGRIGSARFPGRSVVQNARVRILPMSGYCWIDESVPCIVLTQAHYEHGSDLDLYLDLLHEVTHIRQHLEGQDIWDEAFPYHRRPTEIEGYAVAVAEARRLGLDETAIRAHLDNPWMTAAEVQELLNSVNAFLTR